MPGKLVIISAPSGGGKNAIIRVLVEKIPKSIRFLTTITRPMRPGEADGVDYHYISKAEFEQKILAGDFVEYNVYAGEYYGTDRLRLEQTLKDNEVIFLQIDVNGKRAMKKAGIKHTSIFILPENLDSLRSRIEKRGGLSPEIIRERMEVAKDEIAAAKEYDYQVINPEGDMNTAVLRIMDILSKI